MADIDSSQRTFGTSVLLRGEQSDGRVAVIEDAAPSGWEGPPLHHHDWDEAFYVVEGELTFQVGVELITRRAGQLAFAGRGVHHTFANLSDSPARYVVFCTPAGFELYLDGSADEGAVNLPRRVAVGPPIRRSPRGR